MAKLKNKHFVNLTTNLVLVVIFILLLPFDPINRANAAIVLGPIMLLVGFFLLRFLQHNMGLSKRSFSFFNSYRILSLLYYVIYLATFFSVGVPYRAFRGEEEFIKYDSLFPNIPFELLIGRMMLALLFITVVFGIVFLVFGFFEDPQKKNTITS